MSRHPSLSLSLSDLELLSCRSAGALERWSCCAAAAALWCTTTLICLSAVLCCAARRCSDSEPLSCRSAGAAVLQPQLIMIALELLCCSSS